MKTAGIIVEYNPFHNGHQLHIERTRQETGADYVIAVMSGSFVQRGEPALTDKYYRTQMALISGADLVLELPVLFALGSAGDFAAGAVSLLDKLGVVDALCFGSECGDILPFLQTAPFLANEPPAFSALLRKYAADGLSFPQARSLALVSCLSDALTADSGSSMANNTTASLPDRFLSSPNNILGLEYCCALLRRNSAIRPYTVKREGAGYHDVLLSHTQKLSSAAAIRKALRQSEACTAASIQEDASIKRPALSWSAVSDALPKAHHSIWQDILSHNRLLYSQDLSDILRYRLLLEARDGFSQYADVSRELSDKLKRECLRFTDWDSLCGALKSRELTYSRISRALCHILLSLRQDDLQRARSADFVPYARILGFRRQSVPLLSAIRKSSGIPLLSKLADAKRLLTDDAFDMLQQDILSTHLYESAMASKTRALPRNEYTRQICIL